MPSSHAILLLSLITLPFTSTRIFTSTTAAPAAGKPKRLVTKLLHRDSLLYNPNDTVDAQAQRTVNMSMARFIYLSQKSSQKAHDTRAHLHPGISTVPVFYVNFSIGQPPVPQLAVLDTGSSLIWVKCQPCEKCRATTFDPSKSLTYATLPCDSSYCTNDCSGYPDECWYNIRYTNGPDSQGTIGSEQFNFETSDEGKTFLDDVGFGCSHNNAHFSDEQFTGVFGLGPATSSTHSLVEKVGSKFSYCIGNLNYFEYAYNMLILGEGAILEGDSTPMTVIDGSYYVTLEGISLGEKMLDIDPNLFKKNDTWSDAGVFIDSGTTLTWLVPSAYQTLRKEVEDLFQGLLPSYPMDPAWHLCYSGNINRDLQGFPAMAFHFAGGADLVLDAESVFYQESSSVFCLAVGPSDINGERFKDLSIIGMIAQQNYNVAYDLVSKQLYFQRIDCELLADD
ncbi:hypothetical protein WN944_002980 [Citrus x changshan-huyou]|uniref:Peptidase A1 domain-containing protein n=2 Tax=Citrus TaxID=2706 RepID=A0ACB8P8D4_CITSI|nr:peptidase A1 domain-containing protein [Citrus sinensis]